MPAIFISYRRSDSQDVTGRIYDRLVAKFERRQVFKDVDSIPLGVSFPMHLEQMLKKANVVLVIIGPTWVTATDEQGRRRLDDPNDYVRLEVEAALRANMPLIPILVSNTAMPKASDVPPSLQKLLLRNGMPVRPDPDFHNDVNRLFTGIDHLQKLQEREFRKKQSPDSDVGPEIEPKAMTARPAAKFKLVGLIAGLIAIFPVLAGVILCMGLAMQPVVSKSDILGRWEAKGKVYYNFEKFDALNVVAAGKSGMSECRYDLSRSQLRIKPREDRNDLEIKEQTYRLSWEDGALRLEPHDGVGEAFLLRRDMTSVGEKHK